MGLITAMLVATPVFGMALTPPAALVDVGTVGVSSSFEALPMMALLDNHDGDELDQNGADAVAAAADGTSPESSSVDASATPAEDIGALMQQRARNIPVHRALGIATGISMLGAASFGAIQYYNMYGFFAGRDDNPCVRGDAIFGQGQCSGRSWLHLGSGLLTAALYTATYSYSLAMPDPMNLDEGDSPYARNLRMHKILRWVHLGGMIAQVVMGFVISGSERLGLNRADDYNTLRTLSTIHMGIGAVTLGALTWGAVIQL